MTELSDYKRIVEEPYLRKLDGIIRSQRDEIATLRGKLSQALRQWKMYAEHEQDRDLEKDSDPEAILYRAIASPAHPDNGPEVKRE